MNALARIGALALAHFGIALVVSIAAFGWDLDQLRSRSIWSRTAGRAHDVLWFPHDAFMRSLPNPVFVAHARVLTPAAIAANSLLWGAGLYLGWRIGRAVFSRRRDRG